MVKKDRGKNPENIPQQTLWVIAITLSLIRIKFIKILTLKINELSIQDINSCFVL